MDAGVQHTATQVRPLLAARTSLRPYGQAWSRVPHTGQEREACCCGLVRPDWSCTLAFAQTVPASQCLGFPWQVLAEGMAALRAMFQRNGTVVPDPRQFHVTRWAADPWSRGKALRPVWHAGGARRPPGICCRLTTARAELRPLPPSLALTPGQGPTRTLLWATPGASPTCWLSLWAACCLRARPPAAGRPQVTLRAAVRLSTVLGMHPGMQTVCCPCLMALWCCCPPSHALCMRMRMAPACVPAACSAGSLPERPARGTACAEPHVWCHCCHQLSSSPKNTQGCAATVAAERLIHTTLPTLSVITDTETHRMLH